MDIPDNPSKPCLSCTKQWCINQNLPICAGASLGDTDPDTATGKEGDVEARCFRECLLLCSCVPLPTVISPERDSPRDQLVVTLFLLIVFGLLLGAGIKGRMVKAGINTSTPWNTGRKWWQVNAHSSARLIRAYIYYQSWAPPLENIGLGYRGSEPGGRGGREDYVALSSNTPHADQQHDPR